MTHAPVSGWNASARGRWRVFLALLLLTGCSAESAPKAVEEQALAASAMMAPAEMAPAAASRGVMDAALAPDAPSAPDGPAVNQSDSLRIGEVLIRQGTITVEVKTLQSVVDSLRHDLQPVGAVITQETLTRADGQAPGALMVVRVPAQRWEAAIDVVKRQGAVKQFSVNVEDVTTAYRDANARIGSLNALEERLVRMVGDRTGRLQDVLEVEREIARVRTEREQLIGRQQQWREQARLSTLTIQLHEPRSVVERPDGPSPLERIGGEAWRHLEGSVAAVVLLVATSLPWLVLLGLAWIAWRRVRRRRAKASAEAASGTTDA